MSPSGLSVCDSFFSFALHGSEASVPTQPPRVRLLLVFARPAYRFFQSYLKGRGPETRNPVFAADVFFK